MTPTPSKIVITIGGISVNVYSLPGATERSTPVSVLFFLHGRAQKAADYEWVAHSTLEYTDELRKKGGSQGQDLIVVLLVSRRRLARCHLMCLLMGGASAGSAQSR